jgi:hypothetical protein
MVKKSVIVAFLIGLLVLCLNGCNHTHVSQSVEYPTATLFPGTGGVWGYIRTPRAIDQRGLIVYLANTINYEDLIGGFLDLANAPFSHVQDDGYFAIYNVTPGDYVLVVYEVVMGGKALQNETGGLTIIHIEKDRLLNLGIIDFNDW